MNNPMVVSRWVREQWIRLLTLKSLPNGVGRSFGRVNTVHLIQNVAGVRNLGIETNRQHQRDIRARAPDGQHTRNLDFASAEPRLRER